MAGSIRDRHSVGVAWQRSASGRRIRVDHFEKVADIFDSGGQKSAPGGTKRLAFIAGHESFGSIGSPKPGRSIPFYPNAVDRP